MKKLLILAILSICSLTIAFTSCASDTYEVFVYPNKNNLTKHINAGTYKSVEEARRTARSYMQKYPNGDYEIGKNCKNKSGLTVKVCDETFR